MPRALFAWPLQAAVARPVELEIKQNNGIKRVLRKLSRNDKLMELVA